MMRKSGMIEMMSRWMPWMGFVGGAVWLGYLLTSADTSSATARRLVRIFCLNKQLLGASWSQRLSPLTSSSG